MGQKERKVMSVWTVTWGSSLKCEYLADARLSYMYLYYIFLVHSTITMFLLNTMCATMAHEVCM